MRSSVFFITRTRIRAVLLVLLLGTGGWWWHTRSAPVQKHLEAGSRFLKSGQSGAAEREWQEAVRLDPNSAQAWELLGNFYFKARNWQGAQSAFQHLLALRPQTPGLLTQLATCSLKLGDDAKAGRLLLDALKQNPNDIAALKMAMGLAKSAGRQDEWFRYSQRLVALVPSDVGELAALAEELVRRAQYPQARLLAERMVQEHPDLAQGHFLRGLVRYNENPTRAGLKEAQANFNKALQLDPDDVEAHRYLARVYMQTGRPAEAIPHFEAVGRGRPYAMAHLLELSNALRLVGKARESQALQQRFASLRELNRRVMDVQDRLAQDHFSFEDHLQMGRLLLQSACSTGDGYHLYQFRYAQGQLVDVEFYARKALEFRPGNAGAKALLAAVEQAHLRFLVAGERALARHNYAQAQEQLQRAALLRPNDARTKKALQQLASAKPVNIPATRVGAP